MPRRKLTQIVTFGFSAFFSDRSEKKMTDECNIYGRLYTYTFTMVHKDPYQHFASHNCVLAYASVLLQYVGNPRHAQSLIA